MTIDYYNIPSSEEIYIHDCSFEGFAYDYENRSIYLKMVNYYNAIEQSFTLNNVIIINVQSCLFWGMGNAVYNIRCCREHPIFQQLDAIQNENQDNIAGSLLDSQTKYIAFELQFNSGDLLVVICESIDYSTG